MSLLFILSPKYILFAHQHFFVQSLIDPPKLTARAPTHSFLIEHFLLNKFEITRGFQVERSCISIAFSRHLFKGVFQASAANLVSTHVLGPQ